MHWDLKKQLFHIEILPEKWIRVSFLGFISKMNIHIQTNSWVASLIHVIQLSFGYRFLIVVVASMYTAMWIYICAICTSVALLCLASSGQILLSKQFPHEKCIIRRKIKLLRCELHWIHVRNSECKQDFFVKMHASILEIQRMQTN